ncbi:outer membrane lipoprotein-sorting protein [bacterium]|nr:MAG: outer membrane lipoprotein-sorting protein [bacterium]
MTRRVFLYFTLLFFAFSAVACAATGEEVMKKYEAAYYYPSSDFKARVTMKLVARNGQERLREMTMIRKNYGGTGGEQKYFVYFFQPADVQGTAFMVYKHPAKDDDRWLFVPAINMVKRLASQDNRSSFVGSDFTYEDVSGRDIGADTHTVLNEEVVKGNTTYVVKSVPNAADADYSHKLSWIDAKTYLPVKEEYYDKKGALYKVFTADEVKEVNGMPTVTKRTMKNLLSGHTTEVVFTKAGYGIGVEDSLFTERYLKQPPKKKIE